jgi:hypothetical protein
VISPTAERVGRVLLPFRGHDGQLDPSYEKPSKEVGRCEKTGRTAIKAPIVAGLLRQVRRNVRAGWRVAQTSNSCALLLPAAPLVCAAVGRRRSLPMQDNSKKGCFTVTVTANARLPAPGLIDRALASLGSLLGVPGPRALDTWGHACPPAA